MNYSLKSLASAAIVLATLLLQSTASGIPGGWLDRKWNPESTNAIPRLAMPTDLRGPDSPAKRQTAAPVAKKANGIAIKAANPTSVGFTPSGLAGNLPMADDSCIQELARGLDHDWERCFAFVRNYIAYAPYPGIVKGPERTLLDREGNDADQAFLLCALLRASGYDTATVLYVPLSISSTFDSGFIVPIYDYDGYHPYNVCSWFDVWNDYAISRKFNSNGLNICWMTGWGDNPEECAHIAIEHYWVKLIIDGEDVHLDPSIKPQPVTFAKNAKAASGYDRNAFLAAAGGTTDANSAKGLSESGVGEYLTGCVAALKAAWNEPGASPESVLGKQTITPYADGDPRFHGEWSSRTEPIDLLASSAETLDALRAKVRLDNFGYGFQTPPREPDWTTEFSFYLDEVGSRTLWFAKDENGDLGLYVDDTKVSQSALWNYFGAAGVGVEVSYTDHPTYHTYHMSQKDGEVHVLSINLGGDSADGIRKVATKRISDLQKRGLPDTNPVMRAALLQLQGQDWLAQVERHSRLWSRVVGGEKSHYYNIGIAGQTTGPFVDMANSYVRGWGGSGLVASHMMFSSALEHSVIEQLNGTNDMAVSTVKILSLANASGNPVYFADSNNVATVLSALSGYSTSQKSAFQSATSNGEIYLLPKNATVTLNNWTGTGYIEHGPNDHGSSHTGMIINGGMNGGYTTYYYDPESDQYIESSYCFNDTQLSYVDSSTHADPVVMPAGAYIDHQYQRLK